MTSMAIGVDPGLTGDRPAADGAQHNGPEQNGFAPGETTLDLLTPLPGFPSHTRFVLHAVDDTGLLYALRSATDPEIRLLVAPPSPFFPDYVPQIGADVAADLSIHDPADAGVLVVINPGMEARTATANLRAPLVINVRTWRGAQVVLSDQQLPFRARLVPSQS